MTCIPKYPLLWYIYYELISDLTKQDEGIRKLNNKWDRIKV